MNKLINRGAQSSGSRTGSNLISFRDRSDLMGHRFCDHDYRYIDHAEQGVISHHKGL